MPGNLDNVSTVQQRIATLAQRSPEFAFTSLAHYMTPQWLESAYHKTRKDGAAGIDEITGEQYAENLEENLRSLHERLKSGTYKAPPVRRTHIPKGTSGEMRPIGIPTFEDKIVQRAVVMLLEPIFEHDFYDVSYGFRPGRSAHQALQAVWDAAMEVNGGWVLEVDLRKFFDTRNHQQLQEFVSRRVRDGVLRRLIGKWLNAGVMEDGNLSFSESGSPQGGVISPLLANIYLHYVLDEWFEQTVKPLMRGRCRLIRFADDFAIIFEKKNDAERVMAVIPKRFEKYGLMVHPEKTKLIDFRPPNHWERRREEQSNGDDKGAKRPETFGLLGFTHYWGKTRKGNWAVQRKTMKTRLAGSIQRIKQWCRENMHKPVREQWEKLKAKVNGHYAYYGITGNGRALDSFVEQVKRNWKQWLNRRNNGHDMTWEKFNLLLNRYPLPIPKVVHSIFRKKMA
jgi:group II intron reverse transcriptase/maturase